MPKLNFVQEGNRKKFDAPSGGVEAGDAFLVETSLVLALEDADAGDPVLCALEGVIKNVPADDSDDFDDHAPLYWNDTDDKLFAASDGGTGDGHPFVGLAFGDKAESADVCNIKLVPSE